MKSSHTKHRTLARSNSTFHFLMQLRGSRYIFYQTLFFIKIEIYANMKSTIISSHTSKKGDMRNKRFESLGKKT